MIIPLYGMGGVFFSTPFETCEYDLGNIVARMWFSITVICFSFFFTLSHYNSKFMGPVYVAGVLLFLYCIWLTLKGIYALWRVYKTGCYEYSFSSQFSIYTIGFVACAYAFLLVSWICSAIGMYVSWRLQQRKQRQLKERYDNIYDLIKAPLFDHQQFFQECFFIQTQPITDHEIRLMVEEFACEYANSTSIHHTCYICLEDCISGEKMIRHPICSHMMHQSCLVELYKTANSRNRNICPVQGCGQHFRVALIKHLIEKYRLEYLKESKRDRKRLSSGNRF